MNNGHGKSNDDDLFDPGPHIDPLIPDYSGDLVSEEDDLPPLLLSWSEFQSEARQIKKGATPEQQAATLSQLEQLCPETFERFGAVTNEDELIAAIASLPADFEVNAWNGTEIVPAAKLRLNWHGLYSALLARRDLATRMLMSAGQTETKARIWANIVMMGQIESLIRKMTPRINDAFDSMLDETLLDGVAVFHQLTNSEFALDGHALINALGGPPQ